MTEIKELVEKLRAMAEDAHNYIARFGAKSAEGNAMLEAASALEALISRSAVMEGAWQPIETAPKDGTRIWADWSGEGRLTKWMQWQSGDACWTHTDGDGYGYASNEKQPDRWFSLPAPPARSALSLKAGKE